MNVHALHFNHSCMDCGSVVSITWCDMVMVAVLLGARGEVMVHVVGWLGWVWLGGADAARGGTRHTQHKPISHHN